MPQSPVPNPQSPVRAFLRARLDPKTALGLHLTLGLAVAAAGIWVFSAVVDAVLDNATLVRWDTSTAAWMHAHVTRFGLSFFDVVTQIGSPASMTVLAVAGGVVLLLTGRSTVLVAWIAAFAGGGALERLVKLVVHRARPVYGVAYLAGHTSSFPSGHATASFIGFGMLAYVLALHWRPPRPWRAGIAAICATMILLVGASRVYLGVHYPSDVLGAYALAAAWLAVCLSGLGVAMRRGAVSSS